MDRIVVAAGTALVGAIATDTWQQAREAVTALWYRVHPTQTDAVGTELEQLREQIVQARRDDDLATEKALEGAWQLKLQHLLRADPTLAADLHRVLNQVLAPALTVTGRTRIGNIIMTASSHDSSTFTQIGTQTNCDRP